jgi:hypothetical protein
MSSESAIIEDLTSHVNGAPMLDLGGLRANPINRHPKLKPYYREVAGAGSIGLVHAL